MGASQSTVSTISYTCSDCGIPFTRSGTQKLRTVRCDLCSDKQQQTGNPALVCSLCRKVFRNDVGYLAPQDRLNVRCKECGDMMRGHMENLDYKAMEADGQQVVFPSTMEDHVKESLTRSANKAAKRGLPPGSS